MRCRSFLFATCREEDANARWSGRLFTSGKGRLHDDHRMVGAVAAADAIVAGARGLSALLEGAGAGEGSPGVATRSMEWRDPVVSALAEEPTRGRRRSAGFGRAGEKCRGAGRGAVGTCPAYPRDLRALGRGIREMVAGGNAVPLVSMAGFAGIFAFACVYALKKGALTWRN